MKEQFDDEARKKAIEELTMALIYLTRFNNRSDYYRFEELAWKGYDFDILEKLDNDDMIIQPKSRHGYNKYVYLTEKGRDMAREILKKYNLPDKMLHERFDFRVIKQSEIDEAANIEQICFPPNEACTPDKMEERIKAAPELFLVAVDKGNGKIAGFLNGISTNEYKFRDEFFLDAGLYDPDGKYVMLLGLDVLPEYRRIGLATEIVNVYCRKEKEKGRKSLILTCLDSKVKMYKKMGFTDRGIADSTWGGEEWHEMEIMLDV